MAKYTIFTPTYNRAHTLDRLYQSIKKQSFKDFEWLIIDDGSIDRTRELIDSYIDHSDFPIYYYFKKNGGKYTAMVEAKKYIQSKYVIIIDSDDELLEGALHLFESFLDVDDNISEYKARCVNSSGYLIKKFNFPEDKEFIDCFWHEMVLKNKNDEELISCFKTNYYKSVVEIPNNLLLKSKFKYLSEVVFWAKDKTAIIRYINYPARIYHSDSENSITNNTETLTGFYDDIVGFKYFLDLNYNYIFWRPAYFISLYVKLVVASKIVGLGFVKGIFIFDHPINKIISFILSPLSMIYFYKSKYWNKKYWR